MKRAALFLLLLVAAGGLLMLLVRQPRPSTLEAEPRATTATATPKAPAGTEEAAPAMSQAEAARQGSPLAARLNAPETPPAQDVVILRDLVSQYVTALQRRAGPPIGDDADLARALTGRNPLKLAVIPGDHPAISAEGRLLDRWGTPYHIHARSSQSFEFRSAGPDKRLFTGDDLVSP